MLLLFFVLLLVLIFFGVGIAVSPLLWIIAAVILLIWLFGFVRPGGGRWYGR
jgi:hypothetical protein